MTPRVREILSWYGSENIGVLTNLARVLKHRAPAGNRQDDIAFCGRGLRLGPSGAFSVNPDSFSPSYPIELGILAGANAVMAPLGALETALRDYAGEIPCFLKANSAFKNQADESSSPFFLGGVSDALRLGCVGLVLDFDTSTLSPHREAVWSESMKLIREAKQWGLVTVANVVQGAAVQGATTTEGAELDKLSLLTHQMAQLGAHMVCLPIPRIESLTAEIKKHYQSSGVRFELMAERARHLLHSNFNGQRLLLFRDESVLMDSERLIKETNDLAKGGAFGSVLGVNAFQRRRQEAIALLGEVMDAFGGYNTGRNMR